MCFGGKILFLNLPVNCIFKKNNQNEPTFNVIWKGFYSSITFYKKYIHTQSMIQDLLYSLSQKQKTEHWPILIAGKKRPFPKLLVSSDSSKLTDRGQKMVGNP